jgi:hypothetical protein
MRASLRAIPTRPLPDQLVRDLDQLGRGEWLGQHALARGQGEVAQRLPPSADVEHEQAGIQAHRLARQSVAVLAFVQVLVRHEQPGAMLV